jgi:hypothetical protein
MNLNISPLHTLEHVAAGAPITRLGVSLIPLYTFGERRIVATGPDCGLTIEERPSAEVPFLEATNHSRHPGLLVSGQVVTGGLQTRVLNVSVLIGAGQQVTIPVSCVERGRWNNHDEFRSGNLFASRLVRATKDAGVADSVARDGSRFSNQGAVWHSVDHELRRLNIDAPTASFAALESAVHRDGAEVANAVRELQQRGPLPGQCGVVVCHGRTVVSAELFGSPAMLDAHWNALVASILLDAPDVPVTSRPSVTSALRFVRRLATASAATQQGVALGTEVHVRNHKVVAQALVDHDVVLHASAFALAA